MVNDDGTQIDNGNIDLVSEGLKGWLRVNGGHSIRYSSGLTLDSKIYAYHRSA